jgi:hypothetical protein
VRAGGARAAADRQPWPRPHLRHIKFNLDDGTVAAHKALLMARCDVMWALSLAGDFRESAAKVVINIIIKW